MPQLLPTLKTASVLALIAILAAAGVATQLARGETVVSCSDQEVRPAFEICGDLARPLAPGTSQPLDMQISNPTRHRLHITRLTVSLKLDSAHERAGCTAAHGFRVTGLGARQYPIVVPPRSTRSLRALGIRPLPRVRMLALPANQDVCKGAKLHMRFLGRAQRWHWAGRG